MAVVTLACQAMATRFELVLHGDNPAALRAAAEEAVDTIEKLEDQLSLYRSWTEIAHLNARAAIEPIKVSPPVFALLKHARSLSAETGGVFDITIAPLVRCWGFMHGTGRVPTANQIAEACAQVGMNLVELNESEFTVRFLKPGVMLDLGAIGKGYAIDRALDVLREAGIANALLHGGTSTVYALGRPPGADYWQVALDRPPHMTAHLEGFPATIPLRDEALSVSASWAKAFQAEGKSFGHLLDPRTGAPSTAAVLAAVILPSATETDALSTALLVGGHAGHQKLVGSRPAIRTVLVLNTSDGLQLETHGLENRPPRTSKTI
jgi:thiamine biosynthesis lipoprotein